MGGKITEACGRCAMSSVVDVTASEDSEDDSRDPFGEARIELDADQLRSVSPSAWFESLRGRVDDVATRLTYGR